MSSLPPYATTVRRDPRKTPISTSDAMRRNRVLTPMQCRDNTARLHNLRNLISATDREYRTMLADLDRLDREGRVWLVVDFIHKTSLASLDLAANILTMGNERTGTVARGIADATQTTSDVITGIGDIANGEATASGTARTVIDRVMTHTGADSVGGTYGRGRVGTAMSMWNGYENINAAGSPEARNRRATEAAIDLAAAEIQANAETIDKATQGGSRNAQRVGAAAGLIRAMGSYRREVEGVFDRRFEVRSSLQRSRNQLEMQIRPTMDRWRREANEIVVLLEGCDL